MVPKLRLISEPQLEMKNSFHFMLVMLQFWFLFFSSFKKIFTKFIYFVFFVDINCQLKLFLFLLHHRRRRCFRRRQFSLFNSKRVFNHQK